MGPAISQAFTPVIDYELTVTMVIESAKAREEIAADFVTHRSQLSPYPHLFFKSSIGVVRFHLNDLRVSVGADLAAGRTMALAWKHATIERPDTGAVLPLRCQSVSVDGIYSRDKTRKPNEVREEGVPFPESRSPATGKSQMNCTEHNLGRLFDTGLPFGAELTRKPLAVRLLNPGSEVCVNIPCVLDGQPARVRLCAMGHAASARISYH